MPPKLTTTIANSAKELITLSRMQTFLTAIEKALGEGLAAGSIGSTVTTMDDKIVSYDGKT